MGRGVSQELYQAADIWRKGTDFKHGEGSNNVSVSVERKNIPLGKLLIAFAIQNPLGKKIHICYKQHWCNNMYKSWSKPHHLWDFSQNWSEYMVLVSLLYPRCWRRENIMVISFTNGQVVHDSFTWQQKTLSWVVLLVLHSFLQSFLFSSSSSFFCHFLLNLLL